MSSPIALAVAAHPDDIEFLMSGTLMRLAEAGYEIHYWNLADGCCGSTVTDRSTTAEIRREEAIAAAEKIGAVFHESICHDLEIFYDRETLAKVASEMRPIRPNIILTHPPVDYMEDHMNTCRLVVTAAFTRGMPNFPVQPARPSTTQKVAIYHAQPYPNRDPLGNIVRPQLAVDVSDLIFRKREMLALHRSQKQWLDESQGVDSYLDTMVELAAEMGNMSERFSHAEGFRQHLHTGFGDSGDDPLSAALGNSVMKVPTY